MRTVRTFKRHETTQVPDKKPQLHAVHGTHLRSGRVVKASLDLVLGRGVTGSAQKVAIELEIVKDGG